jgi:hypothetical protein
MAQGFQRCDESFALFEGLSPEGRLLREKACPERSRRVGIFDCKRNYPRAFASFSGVNRRSAATRLGAARLSSSW